MPWADDVHVALVEVHAEVDAVGAGVGEVVLYASGSSARQTKVTKDRPVDATIMAIVDQVAMDGDVTYTK